MASPTPVASQQHNHEQCIETALTQARAYCSEQGLRLTPQREQIFRLIWQSHKPLGAYTLMDMLSAESTRRIAPPTIYRALDFLLEHQLIHRIHSLNAFVGCTHPDQQHGNNFMICEDCGIAIEFSAEQQNDNMTKIAKQLGFKMKTQSIEVVGLCQLCSEAGSKGRETGGQHDQ
jgi:Fur family zinc uptake transcriptional regulator